MPCLLEFTRHGRSLSLLLSTVTPEISLELKPSYFVGNQALISGVPTCPTTLTQHSLLGDVSKDNHTGGPGNYYCAVRPPSIINSVPVTKDDSSEAKYRTA